MWLWCVQMPYGATQHRPVVIVADVEHMGVISTRLVTSGLPKRFHYDIVSQDSDFFREASHCRNQPMRWELPYILMLWAGATLCTQQYSEQYQEHRTNCKSASQVHTSGKPPMRCLPKGDNQRCFCCCSNHNLMNLTCSNFSCNNWSNRMPHICFKALSLFALALVFQPDDLKWCWSKPKPPVTHVFRQTSLDVLPFAHKPLQ